MPWWRGNCGHMIVWERHPMSYSTTRANILSDVLERIATLNIHQLVGHRDNLEFWLNEINQAIAGIDGYSARFARMKKAQMAWVSAHKVTVSVFCELCGGGCEFGPEAPSPPTRVPSADLDDARKGLREAGRRLLRRLYRAHMLTRAELLESAERIGTGFEPNEVQRDEPAVTPM